MNGNNIIVYQQNGTSWTAIAATQSDELQVEGETIEISSATDSDWVHRIAGRKNWSLNVNWLVTEVADIRKVLTVNTRVKVPSVDGHSHRAPASKDTPSSPSRSSPPQIEPWPRAHSL